MLPIPIMYSLTLSSLILLVLVHVGYSDREPYPLVITSDHQGSYPYSYLIRWETPQDGGAQITQYQFKFREVEVRPGTWEVARALTDYTFLKMRAGDAPMTSTPLDGLHPNTYYEVLATLSNDVGISEPTFFVFVTADGIMMSSSGWLSASVTFSSLSTLITLILV